MDVRWWGWGTLDRRYPEAMVRRVGEVLQQQYGFVLQAMPPVAIEQVHLPPPRLSVAARQALAQAAEVHGEMGVRLTHAYGKSYPDLVRLRRGEVPHPPDAVAFPHTAEEVQQLLRAAAEHGVAVIPFGGGTSVVGGVEPGSRAQGTVTVDMRCLNRLLHVDPVSQLATFQAGVLGPDLEALLHSHGFALGHFPQSFEYSTLGGWIATRSAGQNSCEVGRIEDLVESLDAVLPTGQLKTARVPAMAVGPSMDELLLGSEGMLGIITEATVRIHRPRAAILKAALFPDWESGCDAVRAIAQGDMHPTLLRLSDPAETELQWRTRSPDTASFHRTRGRISKWVLSEKGLTLGRCCLMLLGAGKSAWEELEHVVSRHDGFLLGEGPARHWLESRFMLPFLRDAIMDQGVLNDTLETAGRWSRLPELYQAGRQALLDAVGQPGIVLCHISHIYEDGASLYFTFIAPRPASHELEFWSRIRDRAVDAFLAHGGALSHHHGIGRAHTPWMGRALGETAVGLLHTLKQSVDPDDILNPGKLLPEPVAEGVT
ncbi:MAG: FAD-binding oxidoreductase [Candidatus Xenobia bacterium]